MRLATESITPEKAVKWLENNSVNRHLIPSRVNAYARDMEQGRWLLNGQSIIFNGDGGLLDGQHRLHAVVESGVTIKSIVVRGAPPEAFASLDQGKARSAADVLSIERYVEPKQLASTISYYHKVSTGRIRTPYRLTNQEVLDIASDNPHLGKAVDTVLEMKGKHSLLAPVGMVAGVYGVLMKVDEDDAYDFLRQLIRGVGVREGSAMQLLRDRLADAKSGRKARALTPVQKTAIIIKAWNFMRDSKAPKQLSYRQGHKRSKRVGAGKREDFPVAR